MKTIKLAIIGVLGLASTHTMAALCTLSATPTGSAYIHAYNQGRTVPPLTGPAISSLASRTNFGSDFPYAGSAGDCEVSAATDSTPPETGYTLVASTNRIIPSVTGGTVQIGTVYDRVWRNSAGTSCYFGARVLNLINIDHDSSIAGVQYFVFNDIARGGYSNSGNTIAGYAFIPNSNGTPIYRIGRTFTSVQHRSYRYGASSTQAERQNNGSGYLDLPTIDGSSTLSINGVNTPLAPGVLAPTPLASQQTAQLNNNWVDFTAYATYLLPNGSSAPSTAMTYIKSQCDSTNPALWVKQGAIRVRQTANQNENFKEIAIQGYAPPGATVP